MEEYIADRLYSTTGNIKDVPNMESLPEEIQQLLHQYEDVFCEKFERGSTMKIEPVDIKVDMEREKPPECIRP